MTSEDERKTAFYQLWDEIIRKSSKGIFDSTVLTLLKLLRTPEFGNFSLSVERDVDRMFYKFLLTAEENIDKLDETSKPMLFIQKFLYEYVFKDKILAKANFLFSLVQTKFGEYFQHNLL